MTSEEERLDFEAERFMWFCNPFGSLDIREALRFGLEFGINADKIVELAKLKREEREKLLEMEYLGYGIHIEKK